MRMENTIFIGCNYSEKSIKAQFDKLKISIENKYPIKLVIFDRRISRNARDIWEDIKSEIDDAKYAYFDLTGFRPNVVLELGYALAVKKESEIVITHRVRKTRGESPKWMLSDIGHLLRIEYKSLTDLEKSIETEIGKIPFMKKISAYNSTCKKTSVPQKNFDSGMTILKSIRDNDSITEAKAADLLKGTNLKSKSVLSNLKQSGLISSSRKKLTIV